jgi:protein gp37
VNATKIEWTDRTWNPVTGCTKVSPGCDHCYAEGIARHFAGGSAFPNGFDVTLRPEKLDDPRRWRKPARVFVNSMSDRFHDDVPTKFIAEVFAVMAETPQHTYQILTKRHGRMRALMRDPLFAFVMHQKGGTWPLPNVWLGVSVEDQKWADLRIPALLDTPAAVRFLSCEPLLGEVNLWRWVGRDDPDAECLTCGTEEFSDRAGHDVVHRCGHRLSDPCEVDEEENCRLEGEETGEWCDGPIRPHPRLAWVIVGGESGPGARRMELDWAQYLVGQCQRTGTPVFVKQLGSAFGSHKGGDMDTWPAALQVREFPAPPS